MTKQELIALFVDGHLATGADFAELISSLKAVQTTVEDPTVAGYAAAFIDSIVQDQEGKITVSKKYAAISEYTPVAYDGNAAALSIGGKILSISSTIANENTKGRYLLMPNASSSPTDTRIYVTVEDEDAVTGYAWMYLGSFGEMTFSNLQSQVATLSQQLALKADADNVLKPSDIDDNSTAADKLVSAQKVSQIAQDVDDLKEVIGTPDIVVNLGEYNQEDGVILYENSILIFRNNGSYGLHKFILIPMSNYVGRTLRITPNANTSGYAFLTSDTLVSGSAAPLCNDCTVVTISEESEVTVPNDCQYIYVRYANSAGTDLLPTSFVIEGEDSQLYTKTEADALLADKASKSELDDAVGSLLVQEWQAQNTSEGIYKPTNQGRTSDGARIWTDGNLFDASSASALVTDLITIQPNTRYKLKSKILNYFAGVAYYNDGGTFVGFDANFYSTSNSSTIVDAELTIPSNATKMRLASADTVDYFEVSIYFEGYVAAAKKSELDALAEDVSEAQDDIQYLYGVAEAAGTIDVANAVRYIPTKTFYLGENILNVGNVTYDDSCWRVVDGVIKYNGTGSSSTPFTFNAITTSGKNYLAEITSGSGTNLFKMQIGDGAEVDPYNGNTDMRDSVLSDGGSFKIIPYGTNQFQISAITLCEIVASEESENYDHSLVVSLENVSNGNSAATLMSGKWNVAIGPTTSTMAHNVNGSRSIAIGLSALSQWTTGKQNVGVGTFALYLLQDGNENVAIGADALYHTRHAEQNVVIGQAACVPSDRIPTPYNYLMERNVFLGHNAGAALLGATSDVVAVGYKASRQGGDKTVSLGTESNSKTSANSVFVGYKSDATANGVNNATCIGYGSKANGSNAIAIGFGVSAGENTIVVGASAHLSKVYVAGKHIVFNDDHTVTWED